MEKSSTKHETCNKKEPSLRRKCIELHACVFIALGPSERRVLLSQRSDFAEKQHNLALGSRSGWISPQRGTISANGEQPFQHMY